MRPPVDFMLRIITCSTTKFEERPPQWRPVGPMTDEIIDRRQRHVVVHTAPSQGYTLGPGLSCCSVLHWESRIDVSTRRYRKTTELCNYTVCLPHRQACLTTVLVCICKCSSGWGKETKWTQTNGAGYECGIALSK